MGRPTEDVLDRILSRIEVGEDNDCWNWKGVCNPHGYPIMQIGSRAKRKTCKVHRVLYQELVGKLDKDELVLHNCDNKKCLNPRHLESGNYQKNNQDAWNRGLKRRNYK